MFDADSIGINQNEALPVTLKVSVPGHSLTVGDTFEVSVSAVRPDPDSFLLLMPASAVSAKGLEQIAVRQESGRAVRDGKEWAESHIIYTVVAKDTGNFEVAPLRIMSSSVQGNTELRTDAFSVSVRPETSPVIFMTVFLIFICLAGALVLFFLKRRRFLMQKGEANERVKEMRQIREEFNLLKLRASNLDSRKFMATLEKICTSWAFLQYGDSDLEELSAQGFLEGWDSLLAEFAHARYGGIRETYMNLETWKAAGALMSFNQED
ncbi:MAG: BatD family protein [Fibrobacter sp.]|jgi:hypothetical protein|nr:BatD family protein [Fibrobacter sp.]